jgi:hypothetical protein
MCASDIRAPAARPVQLFHRSNHSRARRCPYFFFFSTIQQDYSIIPYYSEMCDVRRNSLARKLRSNRRSRRFPGLNLGHEGTASHIEVETAI